MLDHDCASAVVGAAGAVFGRQEDADVRERREGQMKVLMNNVDEGAVDAHKGAVKIHEGVVKAHEGPVGSHEGAVDAHKGAVKIHEGVVKAHEGPVGSNEGALDAQRGLLYAGGKRTFADARHEANQNNQRLNASSSSSSSSLYLRMRRRRNALVGTLTLDNVMYIPPPHNDYKRPPPPPPPTTSSIDINASVTSSINLNKNITVLEIIGSFVKPSLTVKSSVVDKFKSSNVNDVLKGGANQGDLEGNIPNRKVVYEGRAGETGLHDTRESQGTAVSRISVEDATDEGLVLKGTFSEGDFGEKLSPRVHNDGALTRTFSEGDFGEEKLTLHGQNDGTLLTGTFSEGDLGEEKLTHRVQNDGTLTGTFSEGGALEEEKLTRLVQNDGTLSDTLVSKDVWEVDRQTSETLLNNKHPQLFINRTTEPTGSLASTTPAQSDGSSLFVYGLRDTDSSSSNHTAAAVEIWWIPASCDVSVLSPKISDIVQTIEFVLLVMTGVSLVGVGGQIDTAEVVLLLRKPSILAIGLFCRFAVMPAVSNCQLTGK